MSLTKEDYADCLFNPLDSGRMMVLHEKLRHLFWEYEPQIEEMAKPKKKKGVPLGDYDPNFPEKEEKSKAFKTGSSLLFDKVIRYIIMVYDKNSPLKAKENKLITKKSKACSLVGFNTEDNKLSDSFAEEMIQGKIDIVNTMIVSYLRTFRSHLLQRIVAMEEAFGSALESVLAGSHEKKSTDQIKQLGDDIENMYIELFSGKDVKLTDEMLIVLEEERVGLKAEDYAQRVANGEYISP